MANDEVIGPRKTMFVLVIVVGCFAVLWPRILSPLVLGPTREQIQPNQFDREAGCCEVIFETDVALLELVNEVCHLAWGVGKLSAQSAAECRKAVNDTCGMDIAVFLKRNENVGKTTKMLVETMQSTNSSCLREHFGVPIYSFGHHLAANSWNVKDTLKQERAPPMRGMGPHPALRERGRAIPPGPPGPPPPPARPVTLPPHIRVRSPLSVYYEDEQPPPIPGMRPPLGSPGGPVAAPKSSMGFVMPIYTICIIVFFVYTLTKIMFRRQGSPYDPVAPDPQFRRRVFRDDSRTSPEKLGKKEADTIVTAISGLVAEVQQQMEASGAPNQQRQDVQDNTRPYTNGTILLNSGPVQIVASEYKEASKEKTPEPTEKESTPEPKEAEATKVVTESSYKEDESISGTKESLAELEQPSPETVVVRKSSPEPSVTEDCEKSSRGPELAIEPISIPVSNPPLAPSVTEVAKESILEVTSELKESTAQLKESTPEVFQGSAPESNLNLVEAIAESEVSKDISLPSDSEEIVSELNESNLQVNEPSSEFLTELVDPTTELKTLLQEPTGPISEPKESSPDLKSTPESTQILSEFEKLIELENHSLEFNELVPDLKESSPPANESSPKAENFLIESKELSTLNDLSLDSLPSTIESQETSSEPEKSIIQSKELSIESESSSLPKKSPLTLEPKDPSPESKEPILQPICPSKYRLESEDSESNISSLNIKEPVASIPEHQTITEDLDQSISKHKESSAHKESTPELTENSQEIKAPIVERSPESKFIENSPEIEAPIVEGSSEPKLTEHSPEIEARVVERSPETELTDHSPEVETESLRLKEPTPQSKETTPERKLIEESKTLLDLEEAIADVDDRTEKQEDKQSKEAKTDLQDQSDQPSDDFLKKFEITKATNDIKDDLAKTNDQFLKEERFVLVRQSTPDVIEENKKLHPHESKSADDYKLYTEPDEEDLENAAVKVMGMEMTAHPEGGGEWPRDERPLPPASPQPRAPHAAEAVQSIFLETEIPQQSRVLVAQFEENRPPPAAHAPLVVSGKMTLSLIQDAPRDTPDRDLESTLDEFTTASAVTQPAAEKGEMESDEEIDEEIEVEEIELEEEEEEETDEDEEEPLPVKAKK